MGNKNPKTKFEAAAMSKRMKELWSDPDWRAIIM